MVANVLVISNLWSRVLETGQISSILLPLGPTVDASQLSTALARAPLVEAFLVDVLTTSSLAPNKLFTRCHFKNTDRTLAVDGLARTIVDGFVMIVSMGGSIGNRSVGEAVNQ